MAKRSLLSSPRLFTAETANRTLPLVRAIVADLAPLAQDVAGMQSRIQHLLEDRDVEQGDPYSDELKAMQEKVARDSQRVEGFVEELRQIGVEFKGPHGHVGFPSMLEGRLVYLSWQLGEAEVSHWMDLDAEFAGRQSLLTSTVLEEGSSPAV